MNWLEPWVLVATTFLDIWLTYLDPQDDLDPQDPLALQKEFEEACPGWTFTIWPAASGDSVTPNSSEDMVVMLGKEEERYFVYYEASEDAPFWLIGNYNILALSSGMVPIYHIWTTTRGRRKAAQTK